MKKIRDFAVRHAIIYCILIEILVLGGMMIAGTLIGLAFRGSDADYYVLMALQELCGGLIALAALEISGCGNILKERGIGFGKGLLVGGYFLVIGLYSGVLYLMTYEGERVMRPWYLILVFIICMFLVGITEEFLCRGVLAELLRRHYGATPQGVWKAVIISGILFGAAHLTNLLGAEPVGVLVQCVSAGLMGMAFAAIYFRCGCIWVTVVLHGFVDLCALLTSGLYAGSVEDVISGYTPVQLIGTVPYVIVVLVVLRKKKMKQIITRMEQENEF